MQNRRSWLPEIWRRRLGGSTLVAACYALPIIWPQVYNVTWHWFGSVWFDYGELLSLLPGAAIVALAAPTVGYKRRKAWAIFFPPKGLQIAWVVGIRLAQLPARPWKSATHEIPDPVAWRLAVLARRFRSWRHHGTLPVPVESDIDAGLRQPHSDASTGS